MLPWPKRLVAAGFRLTPTSLKKERRQNMAWWATAMAVARATAMVAAAVVIVASSWNSPPPWLPMPLMHAPKMSGFVLKSIARRSEQSLSITPFPTAVVTTVVEWWMMHSWRFCATFPNRTNATLVPLFHPMYSFAAIILWIRSEWFTLITNSTRGHAQVAKKLYSNSPSTLHVNDKTLQRLKHYL